MTKYAIAIVVLLSQSFINQLLAQGKNNKEGHQETGIFYTDVPAHDYDIILGRPTNHSITISITVAQETGGIIKFGTNKNKLVQETKPFKLVTNKANFIELENLEADKQYFYQLVYTSNQDNSANRQSAVNSFHTARKAGSSFTFTIQADSHLDENTSTAMYLQTLQNMATDSTDFLVDLGDTWMTDKYRANYKDSYKQYLAQRYYFGSLCKSAALFATLGNHDGESGQQLKKGGTDNMTYWSTTTRKDLYPNPFPNQFYSGNTKTENGIGTPENYYAWEWGNALFIVLDPFRFTVNNRNPWDRTLGLDQYHWLKNTLEKSKATFKFVFIHNLVGGADNKGIARGGAEAAKYFEWGGLDTSGVNAFDNYRKGWEKPIHDLLVANKVNVLFHGHDHFFAKQDFDGLVYQLLPQPGAMRYGNINSAKDYGYNSGKILNSPGYIRVKIEDYNATIDYVQTSITSSHKNKEILYSYSFKVKK